MLEQFWQTLVGILIVSTPLILAALGGMFSEKSGIVNIGLEGIMTFSAFLTTLGILLAESFGIIGIGALIIGVIFGMVGGFLFAYMHGFLTIKMKVDQIISGTAINIIGLGLGVLLTKIIYGAGATPFRISFPVRILNIPLFVILTIILALLSYFIIENTKWGLRVKACGESPQTANSVGVNVEKIRMQAVLLSGIFGALGGASVIILISGNFSATTISGKGFIALAVLIFGQWKPLGIVASGLLFGFLTTLGVTINVISISQNNLPIFILIILICSIIFAIYKIKNKIVNTLLMLLIYILTLKIIYNQGGIPSVYYDILPYIMTIVALIYYSKEKTAPSALGEPFQVDGI